MRELYDQVARIADTEVSVLITGESGTGKELVARALHRRSRRQAGPLVAINCAGLPDALLEGVIRPCAGSLHDARSGRRGLFLEAENGTLLLDEIGEFPCPCSPSCCDLGAADGAAPTEQHRNFLQRAGSWRPPTATWKRRWKRGDFATICCFGSMSFICNCRRCGPEAPTSCCSRSISWNRSLHGRKSPLRAVQPVAERLAYAWPGNVRELRDAMERAVALTAHSTLTADDLPERIRESRATQVLVGGDDPRELKPFEEMERRYILHVLRVVGGTPRARSPSPGSRPEDAVSQAATLRGGPQS